MTIDCNAPPFRIGAGTIWEGRNLHELYAEAQTPWEWHEPLAREAANLGLHCLSTPFDASAVRFLDELDFPAIKIASFELVDLELIAIAAATGRPSAGDQRDHHQVKKSYHCYIQSQFISIRFFNLLIRIMTHNHLVLTLIL